MSALIEGDAPRKWQDLEVCVGRILAECGYEVTVQKRVRLARGDANIDVWADDHSLPPNVIAVECKHWSTAVPKHEVHSFRTVVGDSGANSGFIVSSAGFQSGAVAAAAYSNVRLMDWVAFQRMFVERWYRDHMAPKLHAEADPLIEYTEPMNSRVFRKAKALATQGIEAFEVLRIRHVALGLAFVPLYRQIPGRPDGLVVPELPLRQHVSSAAPAGFPNVVLDATALRPLMAALIEAWRAAIAEFDEIFGERA